MKTFLLQALFVLCVTNLCLAQNVFNPSDPITRYNKSAALGSSTNPNPAKKGLQKWVSTPTNGISTGSGFNATSYKQYFLNYNGSVPLAFRIKFPRTYTTNTTAKFPAMVFLHGAGEVGCPTNGGIYNNEKQLWLGGSLFQDRVNSGEFDGFLIYPQLVNATECWGSWLTASTTLYTGIISMIDSLGKYARLDIDRILVDGLSGGGYGAWRFADIYPTRITKIAPSAAAGSTTNRMNFVHIPIWFATGGKDPDPSPAQADYALNRMKEIGADIRYTRYPDLGHSVWYNHWREPDFVAFMNDNHKANPLVFFQRYEFCGTQAINTKIGITPGFYEYEWQKDNVTIARRTGSTNTIVVSAPIISYTGNEITVRQFGTYRVRFRRTSGSAWSAWSPKPAVIKEKSTSTPSAPIAINGAKSKVLPSVDGSTTVPLAVTSGFTGYQWVRVSDNAVVSTTNTYNAPVGVYKARYNDQFGCANGFSPNFTVVNANGTPKPAGATALTVTTVSSTSVRLNWTQGSNETGFEVFRATSSGGPYTFITRLATNATTYTDAGLNSTLTYYYVVRAVNETGAAANSNQASADGGNVAPVIGALAGFHVKTDASFQENFTVTDPGDVVTVTIPNKPAFVTVAGTGGANYRITAAPTINDIGFKDITVVATDSKGKQVQQTITIHVTDKNVRSAYVNLGASGKTAPAPWNNWLGNRAANSVISNILDENNAATTFDVTTVSAWTTTTNLGHITGNNAGVVPDAVLQSGIADNGGAKTIRFSGLNTGMRYNLVFIGSKNEGLVATTSYVTGSQSAVMDARYNTYRTANLNNLTPDASGNITVTATRTGGSTYSYLNGIVIEEYASSLTMPAPANLFAEPVDRTTIQLIWSDRTNNEAAAGGYELQRATNAAFSSGLATISLAGNTTSYKNTGLAANTRYYYRVRAKNGSSFSAYSNAASTITASSVVSINFNMNVPNAASPWNNMAISPLSAFTKTGLKNQSGTTTSMGITLVQPFNGEFNAGKNTGNNSGVVPDLVLQSNFWLDNGQISSFRITGLNTARKYRFGFVGSSSLNGWFVGDYTAKYTIGSRSVYLNSWENSARIVHIGDVSPDGSGNVLINFSTTADADWGFNAGVIVYEYTDGTGGVVLNSQLDSASNLDDELYKVKIYPNPFRDYVAFDINNTSNANRVTAELYDLTGRLALRQEFDYMSTGFNTILVKTSGVNMPVGMYVMSVKVNGKPVAVRQVYKQF
ncbi:MAG: fibronectin type III domain-containing protein [Chitinophagaceae bacterium]|nr:fibronectin type III domain-containing protein [Chitinophagaceae bacterium]